MLVLPVDGGKGRGWTSYGDILSPNSVWFDSSWVTAGAQTASHMACEPLPSDSKGKRSHLPTIALGTE